jgi:hypothetical protein
LWVRFFKSACARDERVLFGAMGSFHTRFRLAHEHAKTLCVANADPEVFVPLKSVSLHRAAFSCLCQGGAWCKRSYREAPTESSGETAAGLRQQKTVQGLPGTSSGVLWEGPRLGFPSLGFISISGKRVPRKCAWIVTICLSFLFTLSLFWWYWGLNSRPCAC